MYVTRFAPTPSGPLHFGSLVTLTGAYLRARAAGGRFLLRIEDLDTPRCPPGMGERILKEIDELGFDHDGEVLIQSRNLPRYREAVNYLISSRQAFYCTCTRQSLRHRPCVCHERPVPPQDPSSCSLRFKGAAAPVRYYDDIRMGRINDESSQGGVYPTLIRRDGIVAYNLSCVVDDADCGVTEVVRGADLTYATFAQLDLYYALGFPPPAYLHLPLALEDGKRKLSKQNHARAVLELFTPQMALRAALAFLGQQCPPPHLEDPRAILKWAVPRFELALIPAKNRVFKADPPLIEGLTPVI